MNTAQRLGAVALLATAASAHASIDGVRFFAAGSEIFGEPKIYEIDLATGQIVNEVRTSGIGGVLDAELKGLEFTPDGRLIGFTQPSDLGLYEVNPFTGEGTRLNGTFLNNAFEGGIAPIDNDNVYLVNGAFGSAPELLTVDLNTGIDLVAAQLSRPADISGLSLRSDGTLVGIDTRGIEVPEQLVTIDPVSGQISTLALLDTDLNGVTAGMTVVGDTGYFVYSDFSQPFRPEIWSFDLFTGEQRFVSAIDRNVAFAGFAALIPAPGSALVLLGAGAAVCKRRRAR